MHPYNIRKYIETMTSILQFSIIILIFKFCEHGAFSSESYPCTKDDVCSRNGTRVENVTLSTCCQPCLCAETCTFGRLCCPDVKEFEQSSGECKHQLEFLPGFNVEQYLKTAPGYLSTSYYVVSKCPPHASLTLRTGCEFTIRSDENLYVHDVVTYTIYRNEICARCNGIMSYVKWRSAISVNETEVQDLMEDANVEHKALDENRIVRSVPPVDYPDNINICYRTFIGACNVSGMWDFYDENIIALCHLPQLAPVIVGVTPYRNVFCALCNQVTSEPLPRACRYGKTVGKTNPRFDTLQLLVWVADDEAVADDVKYASNKCPVISQFKSACRDVNCPIGQYHVDGVCVQERFEVYNLRVLVGIVVELDQVKFVNNVFEFIEKNVLPKLKLKENNCALAFYELEHFKNMTSKYMMYVSAMTTAKCPIDTLLMVVRQFEIQFSLPYMIQNPRSEVIHVKASIDYSQTSTEMKVDATLKQKYFCASIKYSAKNIRNNLGRRVLDAMTLASDVYISAVEQTNSAQNDTRIICISEYRRILMENGLFNSGNVNTSLISKVYQFMLLVACFCLN